ncbi:MAG: IPT/TIG domain-containing protein, partial [Mucilaginibacter sp.]
MKHIKLYHLLFLATIAVFVVSSCKKKDKVAPAPTFDNAASITAGYGDTITIKGTNLQNTIGSTTVRLNGQIFSIVKSSNNNVQVLVPKLAGNGQLSISVSGQTYDGPQFTYKYKGIVTTFAGSGTPGNADGKGTAASFNQPWGLAIDSTGNIFVADGGNRAIRKITPDGTVSTIFSLGTTIPVNSFEVPYHIAVNNNTHVLYVTSSYSGNLLV